MTNTCQDKFRSFLPPLLSLVLLVPAAMSRAGEIPPNFGENLARQYIVPSMQRFQASAEHLHATLRPWCATPEALGAQHVEEGFAQLVDAWSRIEFLRFGPLVTANRYEKLNFWPDPRGITLRQVQALLAKPDAIPDATALPSLSVAVQGLPALEYLLYRDGGLLRGARPAADRSHAVDAALGSDASSSSGDDSFSAECTYATTVAGNLAQLGEQLAQEWSLAGEYGQKFSRPSASNALYRTQREVAGEAIKALSTGLQFAREIKLLPVLGANRNVVKPGRAAFWRSGFAARSWAAAAEGMLQFYKAGEYRYGGDQTWIDATLQAELLRIRDNFEAISASVDREPKTANASSGLIHFVRSEEGYRQLTLGALLIKNAKSLVDEDVAPTFDVRIGFNALDGD